MYSTWCYDTVFVSYYIRTKEEEEARAESVVLQSALRLLQPEEVLSDKEEARQQLLRDKWKLYFYENGRCVIASLNLYSSLTFYNETSLKHALQVPLT